MNRTIIQQLHDIESTLGNIETNLEELKDELLNDSKDRDVIIAIKNLLIEWDSKRTI